MQSQWRRQAWPIIGYVNCRGRKKVASALRPIYTAPNAEAALSELERFDRSGARLFWSVRSAHPAVTAGAGWGRPTRR